MRGQGEPFRRVVKELHNVGGTDRTRGRVTASPCSESPVRATESDRRRSFNSIRKTFARIRLSVLLTCYFVGYSSICGRMFFETSHRSADDRTLSHARPTQEQPFGGGVTLRDL